MKRLGQLTLWLIFLGALGCGSSKDEPSSKPLPIAPPSPVVAKKPDVQAAPEPPKLSMSLRLNDPGVIGPGIADLHEILDWTIVQGDHVQIDQNQVIQPVSPGKTELEAKSKDGRIYKLDLQVLEADNRSFAEDIVPLLSRYGCNSGGCHGRLEGQNGFKLAIFGYAPADDYTTIIRGGEGRRIDRISPKNSLILQKASGTVPHGGGRVLAPDSADFKRLASWVEAGTPESTGKNRRIKKLRVVPDVVRTDKPQPFLIQAIAEYDDGTSRDVSSWASWRTLDDRIASIDTFGRGHALEPGETSVVVRFGSLIQALPVQFSGKPLPEQVFAVLDNDSLIDKLVLKHLRELQIAPSELSDDATYLRRVSLDLVGRLPEPAEIRRFVKDNAPDKRQAIVKSLLNDADFQKYWSLKLGDLLQVTSGRQGNAAPFYLLWIQDQLAADVAWDKLVRDLLTTRGDPATRESAAAAYSLVNGDPLLASQLSAQRLLGVRMRCAQCHDHPFDVWTQTQAHAFAAFFAKVRPAAPTPGQMMARPTVAFFPEGEVRHPRTNEVLTPQVFAGNQPKIEPNTDPLPALAEWMTSPDNPMLAKAAVNWLWSQFFATGLVDPVDDLSAANPPSNPELLDALARRFQELKYQIKPMIEEIVASHAYQLSSKSNAGNVHFARLNACQAPRPLTAQQLADALAKATGVPNRFTNKPTGTRAIEIQDPATPSTLLDTLGRCNRNEICGNSGAGTDLNLRQSLVWIASDTVDSKVGALSGYVKQLLDLQPAPDEIVENLYLRTLGRYPGKEEASHWSGILEQSTNRVESVEDLFWALLNSREFLFNH